MNFQNARWIRAPFEQKSEVIVFRKGFDAGKKVAKATAKVSAIGLYALWIDGKRVGNGVLTPGFTSYDKRVQYQEYGDMSFLSDNFDMMKKWVEYLRHAGPEEYLWLDEDSHPGDWLAMDGDPDEYAGATSVDLIATVYYANSVSILVKAGELLGQDMQE